MTFTNPFSKSVFQQKYAFHPEETWEQCCTRVVKAVCAGLIDANVAEMIHKAMVERKFIPGGRYLYASGRDWCNFNNCFLLRAEDSSDGWARLQYKATAMLMSGGGIGVDYSALRPEGAAIKRKGGFSTGPLALMKMVNESGRFIMQGGARRSAIYASLNWQHQDVEKFLYLKDWPQELRDMKEKDLTFPLPMELTNVSVNYDTQFFRAIEDPNSPDHFRARHIYMLNCKQAFRTAEPGLSFNYRKDRETLRNACVTGDTEILTDSGYEKIENLVDKRVLVWNGFEWSAVTPKVTGENQRLIKVSLSDGRTLTCTDYHDFHISTDSFGNSEIVKADHLEPGMKLIKHAYPIIEGREEYPHAYTQGFISADGMDNYNHLSLYEPKYICANRLEGKASKEYVSPTGTRRRHFQLSFTPHPKAFVPHDGTLHSKLEWLAGLLDGDGTELREGGSQIGSVNRPFLLEVQKLLSTLSVQSKVTANNKPGLRSMPDGHGGEKDYWCQQAYRILIGAVQMQELKKLGLHCERMAFDKLPQRDATQFVTIVDLEYAGVADKVYCFDEPKRHLGCFNGIITGQCCEVVSEDDSDKCNLGTVWMNRCSSAEDFHATVRLATVFLLCGGIRSEVPTKKIKKVGTLNNRIGLGLGGMHEWLMQRHMPYEVTDEMRQWLYYYVQGSEEMCSIWSKKLDVSYPKGMRAIAPTGSISILAETTAGIEPLFCKSYKRRYFKDGQWHFQYVIDGTVKSLQAQGIRTSEMIDAYDLSFEQRVKFQCDVQHYVDMAISSTCNMAPWGSESNNEETTLDYAITLLKYAKNLRGFTAYPDGSRGGQPLTRVPIEEALDQEGQVFIESIDTCDISKGGSCGA